MTCPRLTPRRQPRPVWNRLSRRWLAARRQLRPRNEPGVSLREVAAYSPWGPPPGRAPRPQKDLSFDARHCCRRGATRLVHAEMPDLESVVQSISALWRPQHITVYSPVVPVPVRLKTLFRIAAQLLSQERDELGVCGFHLRLGRPAVVGQVEAAAVGQRAIDQTPEGIASAFDPLWRV